MPRMRRLSPWPGPSMASVLHAAAGELEPAEEDAHLLGVVHAVDDDDGRRRRAGRLHEQRRQRGAFIGHLDELDIRMAPPDALVPAL